MNEKNEKSTQPVVFLKGERLYLRPFEEADAIASQAWINDPEVRRYLMIGFPKNQAMQKKFFESQNGNSPLTDIVLAICLIDTDQYIGNTGLHRINWVHRFATSGTVIGVKELWNKGLGKECKRLMLGYGFESLGLRRIESMVFSNNLRSLNHLLKSGYREVGRHANKFLKEGEWVDEILLAITAEEWQMVRAGSLLRENAGG